MIRYDKKNYKQAIYLIHDILKLELIVRLNL